MIQDNRISAAAVTREARESITPQLMRRAARIRRANGFTETPTSRALALVAEYLTAMGATIDEACYTHRMTPDRSGLGPERMRVPIEEETARVWTVEEYYRAWSFDPFWSRADDRRAYLRGRAHHKELVAAADRDPGLRPIRDAFEREIRASQSERRPYDPPSLEAIADEVTP